MKVYLDSLFFFNWLSQYLLLLLTGRVAGEPLRRGRMALAAGLGGLTAALSFLPRLTWLAHPACKMALAALILLVAYGDSGHLLKMGLLFLALSCTFGGGVLLLSGLTGRGVRFDRGVLTTGMDLKLVLLSAAVCYCFLDRLLKRTGRHIGGETVDALVEIGGRTGKLRVLLDNGATLSDPATGRPVLVAEGKRLNQLLPGSLLERLRDPAGAMEACRDENLARRLRLLPYRTVGVDCGFLLAVRADRVAVGEKEFGGLLVALSPNPVSDGGGYGALFGGKMV